MNLKKIAEKNKIWLEKLRALPENKKKIILWTIVVILAIIMGFFWTNSVIKNFSNLSKSGKLINLPPIDVKTPSTDILKTAAPTK